MLSRRARADLLAHARVVGAGAAEGGTAASARRRARGAAVKSGTALRARERGREQQERREARNKLHSGNANNGEAAELLTQGGNDGGSGECSRERLGSNVHERDFGVRGAQASAPRMELARLSGWTAAPALRPGTRKRATGEWEGRPHQSPRFALAAIVPILRQGLQARQASYCARAARRLSARPASCIAPRLRHPPDGGKPGATLALSDFVHVTRLARPAARAATWMELFRGEWWCSLELSRRDNMRDILRRRRATSGAPPRPARTAACLRSRQ